MKYVLLIFLLILLFTIALFLITVNIELVFDSEKEDMHMTMFWLNPFVKVYVTVRDRKPLIKLYIFNKIILNRVLKSGKNKRGRTGIIKLANPQDVHIDVLYGFRNPSAVGVVCGVISMISQYINFDSFNQHMDFLPVNDYVQVDATAQVNIGKAIVRFLKEKLAT